MSGEWRVDLAALRRKRAAGETCLWGRAQSFGAAFQVERSGAFFQLLCLLGLEKSRSDGTALQRQPLGSPPQQLTFCCWVLV